MIEINLSSLCLHATGVKCLARILRNWNLWIYLWMIVRNIPSPSAGYQTQGLPHVRPMLDHWAAPSAQRNIFLLIVISLVLQGEHTVVSQHCIVFALSQNRSFSEIECQKVHGRSSSFSVRSISTAHWHWLFPVTFQAGAQIASHLDYFKTPLGWVCLAFFPTHDHPIYTHQTVLMNRLISHLLQ